jgi:hypothetical protein
MVWLIGAWCFLSLPLGIWVGRSMRLGAVEEFIDSTEMSLEAAE